LLPATPATRGIINIDLLRMLRKDGALQGAYLINAGRGSLQVDADILAALEDGSLAGAALDVFPTEPLPIESQLWGHPKVTITPHNAAQAVPQTLAMSVLRQIDRIELGHPPENTIDRAIGY
jgi:glyoxylate/hydroxypyruvate reductase A